jgi:hypothetical protein
MSRNMFVEDYFYSACKSCENRNVNISDNSQHTVYIGSEFKGYAVMSDARMHCKDCYRLLKEMWDKGKDFILV